MVGKAHKSGHFQNVRLDLDLATILSQVPYFGNVTTLDIYMSLTYAKRLIVNAKPCNTKVDNCQNHHFFNLLCVSVCVCVFVILFLVAKSLWPLIPSKLWTTKGYKPRQCHWVNESPKF
jgi:hypothetical protein